MRKSFYFSCFIVMILTKKCVMLTRYLNSRKLIYMLSARKYFFFFLYSHPSSYFCLRISKFFYTPSLQNFKNELFANAYRIDIFLHYFHYPLRLDIRL